MELHSLPNNYYVFGSTFYRIQFIFTKQISTVWYHVLFSQPEIPSKSFKRNDTILCELQKENGLLDIEITSIQKYILDVFQLFR